jgi:hypothetical protein
MKRLITFSALTLIFTMLYFISNAQSEREKEIRNLEKIEGESWAKKDTAMLLKLFSKDLVVNTPLNRVATFNQVMNLARAGKIDVSSDEKKIEKITFLNDMAIVMGKDVVKPQGKMVNAGKTVTRSYTDIWLKNNAEWKLTIRQATIIKIE